jgi:hypothetical protein
MGFSAASKWDLCLKCDVCEYESNDVKTGLEAFANSSSAFERGCCYFYHRRYNFGWKSG